MTNRQIKLNAEYRRKWNENECFAKVKDVNCSWLWVFRVCVRERETAGEKSINREHFLIMRKWNVEMRVTLCHFQSLRLLFCFGCYSHLICKIHKFPNDRFPLINWIWTEMIKIKIKKQLKNGMRKSRENDENHTYERCKFYGWCICYYMHLYEIMWRGIFIYDGDKILIFFSEEITTVFQIQTVEGIEPQ